MKKIFWLLLPAFIIIAVLFAVQDREFSSKVLLETIKDWRFDNGIDWLENTTKTFNKVANMFSGIKYNGNVFKLFIDVGKAQFQGLVNLITGTGQLIYTIGIFLYDLLHNVKTITDYLFIG